MNGKQLKNSILQWAIQGKLVPQDPNDEPASVLLERIRKEKERFVKEKKIKKDKNASIIFRGEDNSYYEKFLVTGEVKCIDEEILFEIPKNWCWVRLGDILTVKGGKRIPLGDTFAPTPTAHIYIRVTEMKNHTLVDTNLKYISDAVYEKIKNYTISKNDLYLTIAGTIGSVGVVPEKFDGMNLTENAVKLTNIFIDKWFLVYAISSQLVQTQFVDKTKQMAQPKLAIERIQTTIMPLPPYDEQKRIVAKVEELMPILEKYNKSQTNLDRLNNGICSLLSKSILQEAIQGKLVQQIAEEGTAQELIEQIRQEKQKLVKEGKLKKSALTDSVIFKGDDNKYWEKVGKEETCIDDKIPFEIPDSWCWIRHNDIFEISGGSQPPKSHFSDTPRDGYIRLYQIRDYGKNPVPVYIPIKEANKLTIKGDIILARYGASLGKVFWAEDGAYNVAMAKVVPLYASNLICKEFIFLFYCSNIYQNAVKDHSRCAQAGFNKDDLSELFFPLPPYEEQIRIVRKYKEAVASIMSRQTTK